MALIDSLTLLKHIESRLMTITTASGYTHSIVKAYREQRDVSNYDYPFVFINDIKDAYLTRICKNLYRKALHVQIVGEMFDDRRSTDDSLPQLGELLQTFKEDVTKCLASDTYFNSTDCILVMKEIDTLDGYVPPNARFIAEVIVIHYDSK